MGDDEALREALIEALSELRVSTATAPWVEELDGCVMRLELGRVNAEAIADVALSVVNELERILVNCPPNEGRTVRVTEDISWTLNRG